MENRAIKQLQNLGFSQYEAQAYVALLRQNPLNGYELARESGIPRANIYTTLQKLEERGAVLRVDTAEGSRYAPVPSHELLDTMRARFERSLEATNQCLDEVDAQVVSQEVWSAQGYDVMIEHAEALILSAEKNLILAVSADEVMHLQGALMKAEDAGVKVSTLCLSNCERPCPACRGTVHLQPTPAHGGTRWLVLISDGAEMLASEIQSLDAVQTIRTRQRLLVELATWYVRHSVALAAILTNPNGQFESWLSPDTYRVLTEIGPQDNPDGWLGYMRQLMGGHKVQTVQPLSVTYPVGEVAIRNGSNHEPN